MRGVNLPQYLIDAANEERKAKLAPPQYEVEAWGWHSRDKIPPGWEPFAYDSTNGEIICRRVKL